MTAIADCSAARKRTKPGKQVTKYIPVVAVVYATGATPQAEWTRIEQVDLTHDLIRTGMTATATRQLTL